MRFRYHNLLWVFLSITLLIVVFSTIDIDDDRLRSVTQDSTESVSKRNGVIKTYHTPKPQNPSRKS